MKDRVFSFTPADNPPNDGEYRGITNGYCTLFTANGIEYKTRNTFTARGINLPTIVTVVDGEIFVEI